MRHRWCNTDNIRCCCLNNNINILNANQYHQKNNACLSLLSKCKLNILIKTNLCEKQTQNLNNKKLQKTCKNNNSLRQAIVPNYCSIQNNKNHSFLLNLKLYNKFLFLLIFYSLFCFTPAFAFSKSFINSLSQASNLPHPIFVVNFDTATGTLFNIIQKIKY